MDKRFNTIRQRALKLPHYAAEQELSNLLRDCLRKEDFVRGDRFLSDRELIDMVGKSRSVVRRSINRLREEGWLERKPGIGTFVSKTASEIENMCGGIKGSLPSQVKTRKRMKRFGIFGHGQTTWSEKNWCMEFFNAMSNSIAEDSIVMDYIGWNESNGIQVLKSLHYNPPDVIYFLGPGQDHYRIIAKAEELGIPCVLVGVRNPEYGIPCMCFYGKICLDCRRNTK